MKVGLGAKIFIQFSDQFWDNKLTHLSFNKSIVCDAMFYKIIKNGITYYIVSGIILGKKRCDKIKKLKDIEIFKLFVSDLIKTFGTLKSKCLSYMIFDWNKMDNIQCTYTPPTINTDGYKDILFKPINNRVFFGGEHVTNSSPSIQSVMKSSKKIVQILCDHLYCHKLSTTNINNKN